MNETIKIFVELLEEGSPTVRGTQAVKVGEGLYKLLPTPNYDPEDEIWEFVPGTIVRVEQRDGYKGTYLHAVKA